LRRAWTLPDRSSAPAPPGTVLYRGVDNHDQSPRAVRLAGGNAGMLAAMAVSFTIGGIPFIFNGQEIGDGTPTSFYAQTFIKWSNPPFPNDAQAFKTLISLTRTRPALTDGTTIWCNTTGPDRAAAFVRVDAHDRVLVVANLSRRSWTGSVALPAGVPATAAVDLLTGTVHTAAGRMVRLSLGPDAYVIAALQ
jgi:glycosidase